MHSTSSETLRLMRAKLHRVRVTQTRRHYVGSVTIDADLMDEVGLLPLEEVELVNVDNGARWSTYALPGERGSGVISPNGGGASMCEPGHILIIFAYGLCVRSALLENGHTAKVIVANEGNQVIERLEQRLIPHGDGTVGFCSEETNEPHDFLSRTQHGPVGGAE